MLCYLFVISTGVIDCLGRFVPEMTYYVSSGTLNLTQMLPYLKPYLKLKLAGLVRCQVVCGCHFQTPAQNDSTLL